MDEFGSADILFFFLVLWVLGGAVFALQQERVVPAVLAIAWTMVGIAGIYFYLEAAFLGVVQLLLYVGAVAVLMLFGIMLTRHMVELRAPAVCRSWWSLGASVALFLSLVIILYEISLPEMEATDKGYSIEDVGLLLFRTYSLPLEVVSVLLLVAVVGVVVLSRREEEEPSS